MLERLFLALAAALCGLCELGSFFLADETGQVATIFGNGLECGAAICVGHAIDDFGFHVFTILDIPELCFHREFPLF